MKKKPIKYVELNIDSIGLEGVAVARFEDKVHFVKGAVPGDKVLARILKSKSRFAECRVENVIEKSIHRVEPDCKFFGNCGGCSWQMLDYNEQIHWKLQNVKDSFERIGKIEVPIYHPTVQSDNIFHYRNKMDFSFGTLRWFSNEEVSSDEIIQKSEFFLGLHAPGRFDKIVDIDACLIQNPAANIFLQIIKEKAINMGVTAYHPYNREGFLRGLIIRHSVANDEFMIILMTNDTKNKVESDFVHWYSEEFLKIDERITNLVLALNNSSNDANISEINVVHGPGFITENILGVNFRISPLSFFQTNSYQLNKFIAKIAEYAELKKDEVVWDLYCGTGSITLPLANKCKEIYGFELSESSVNDAKNNCSLNKIDNAKFFATDLHLKTVPELLSTVPNPDCLIIDPPRAGIHKNLLSTIMEIAPEKIVYVSCNPATQARDCEILVEKYDITEIQTFDMFPQTYHIESIAKLRKKRE